MKCLVLSLCGFFLLASLSEALSNNIVRKDTDNNIYVHDEASNQQASTARASAAGLTVVYYGRTRYFGWTIGKSNMKKAAEKNPDVLFVTYKMSSDDAWGLDVPSDKVYQFFKNGEVVQEENRYYYLTWKKLQKIIDQL